LGRFCFIHREKDDGSDGADEKYGEGDDYIALLFQIECHFFFKKNVLIDSIH
jgi:hypothetical protein